MFSSPSLSLAYTHTRFTRDTKQLGRSSRAPARHDSHVARRYVVQFLLANVLTEKESGIKEGMYLMGLRRGAYWGSWLITYAIILIPTALVMVRYPPCAPHTHASLLVSSPTTRELTSCCRPVQSLVIRFLVLKSTHFLIVLLLIYFYSLSLVAIVFSICPLLRSAKTASGMGSIITAAMGALPWALNGATLSPTAYGFMSLFPPLGGALAFDLMTELNYRPQGLPLADFVEGAWPLIGSLCM